MTKCGSVSMVTKPELELPPPRVLIVEDNSLIAMDLEDILSSYGCAIVGSTPTVEKALEALERETIDVAVIDYLLEDGDASQLAKVLDEKGIPFAFCTGTEESQISSLYPRTPILAKPFLSDDVSLVVNSLIARRLAA
jgi:CheY-like chemotaxis protein